MISVIIPVYNVATYLDRCIQSVIDQTYADWECVLIDDGSKDQSGLFCDRWQQKDSRIRVIHQQNYGASVARQVGIAASKGEYISFIDADDIVESDYLERLYTALKNCNADIAACDFMKHPEGVDVGISRNPVPKMLEYEELHRRFFKYDFWGFGGKIYKREVFNGIFFPKATINEDYVVMAQLFNKYKRMAYIPVSLYHYIIRDGSLSNQQISVRAMDEYYNKKWVLEFYKKNDLQYVPYAEAQLTETCIKLLRMLREANNPREFYAVSCEMRTFMRSHLFYILRNPHLLLGLKVMAMKTLLG